MSYLKEKFEEKNISKTELAKRTGIDRATLSYYINGKKKISKFEHIQNISIALDLDLHKLIDDLLNEIEGEIQVGEYVRTRQGKIDKVEEIKTISTKMDGNHIYGYKLKNNNTYWIEKEWIVKHSKNIIDLIEVRRLCKWKQSN